MNNPTTLSLLKVHDPLVMYFIVNYNLNMGAGKIAAQCCHATQIILMEYFRLDNGLQLTTNEIKKIQKFNLWLNSKTEGMFRKVILKAKNTEWNKIKQLEQFKDGFIIKDAGLTEVKPESETVIVLWPMLKSKRPKIIKRLRIL